MASALQPLGQDVRGQRSDALEVVQDHEPGCSGGQGVSELVDFVGAAPAYLESRQRSGDSGTESLRGGHLGQIAEPCVAPPADALEGEPRLSDTSRSPKRDEARTVFQERVDLLQHDVAPDETIERALHHAGRRLRRPTLRLSASHGTIYLQ